MIIFPEAAIKCPPDSLCIIIGHHKHFFFRFHSHLSVFLIVAAYHVTHVNLIPLVLLDEKMKCIPSQVQQTHIELKRVYQGSFGGSSSKITMSATDMLAETVALRQQVNELEQRCRSWKAKAMDQSMNLNSLQLQYKRLEEDLKPQIDRLNINIEKKNAHIKELGEEIERLKVESQAKDMGVSQLASIISISTDKFAKFIQDSTFKDEAGRKEAVEGLVLELSEPHVKRVERQFKDRIKNLESKVNENVKTQNSLKDEISVAEGKVKEAEEEYRSLELAKQRQLEEMLGKLGEKDKETQNAIMEVKRLEETLEERVAETKQKLEIEQEKVELANLRAQEIARQNEKERREIAIEKARNQKEMATLHTFKNKVAELENKLAVQQRENQIKIDQLNAHTTALQGELASEVSRFAYFQKQAEEERESIEKEQLEKNAALEDGYKKELIKLQNVVTAQKKTIKKMQKDLAGHEGVQERCNAQLAQAQLRITKAESEKQIFINKYSYVNRQYRALLSAVRQAAEMTKKLPRPERDNKMWNMVARTVKKADEIDDMNGYYDLAARTAPSVQPQLVRKTVAEVEQELRESENQRAKLEKKFNAFVQRTEKRQYQEQLKTQALTAFLEAGLAKQEDSEQQLQGTLGFRPETAPVSVSKNSIQLPVTPNSTDASSKFRRPNPSATLNALLHHPLLPAPVPPTTPANNSHVFHHQRNPKAPSNDSTTILPQAPLTARGRLQVQN